MLEAMIQGYLDCVVWLLPDDEDFNGLSVQAQQHARDDCKNFLAVCEPDGHDLSQMSGSQIGHDFWLTRNGHGAGFWDRGLGSLGEHLTAVSEMFGSSDAYTGDDGLIYLS